jgi:PKHD-type hydroxylase
MVNYSYWLWDKIIPKSICEAVIKDTEWDKTEKGTVGGANNEFILDKKQRETDVLWESPTSAMGCIIQTYMREANKIAGWNYDLAFMYDIQLGRYGLEGHYDWHKDIFNPSIDGMQRKLSCSILLNDTSEFKGGGLVLEEVVIQPTLEQGSIIVFPSFIKHKVEPIIEGNRYSAVGWYSGPSFK